MKITNKQLRYIIKESIKDLLNDGKSYELFGQEFKSKNPNVDVDLMGALDRYFGKPVFNKPNIIYHGTTAGYINKTLKDNPEYLMHLGDVGSESGAKEIWMTTDVKEAIDYAVGFSHTFKDSPVLLVINTEKLDDLRRSVFGSGILAYAWRSDKIMRDSFEIVPLKFKEGTVTHGAIVNRDKEDIAKFFGLKRMFNRLSWTYADLSKSSIKDIENAANAVNSANKKA